MPLIDPASVEEVRQAADLLELVRGQVQLTLRGKRWWGRCPFHDERTPSFSLIPPDNRVYYCQGCGARGDAIAWMRDREGAGSFAEAVEALAERFGVTLRYEQASPEEEAARAARERRTELLDRAAGFYSELLWRADDAAPARDYMRGRGFDEALLRRFRVGWAPGGSQLAGRAIAQGFSREQLVDAGLARLRGGAAQDFFQRRVTFPIADARGRVQGFGGRTLDPADRAKYVNSPEGPGFKKRSLLFGLAEARTTAARQGWICVAEGYTDVLGLVAAGVEGAVACMGTSLTTEQLRALARVVPEVRLCFDADPAGQQAAWRTVEAAAGLPLRLAVVQLPTGQDPGDLASSPVGQSALKTAAEAVKPLVPWLIETRISQASGSGSSGKEQAYQEVIELLRRLPDSVEKDEGVRLATSGLGLSRGMEERLWDATRERRAAPVDLPPRPSPATARERRLLALAVALPGPAAALLPDLAPEAFAVPEHRRAFELIASGEADPGRWPEDLAGLAVALASDVDPGTATEPELREAVYRLQLPLLERRAAELRAAGRDEERMAVLDLAHRLRTVLRGES